MFPEVSAEIAAKMRTFCLFIHLELLFCDYNFVHCAIHFEVSQLSFKFIYLLKDTIPCISTYIK
jgi:hypothetical protein